jgi:hypothetical protein
MQEQEYSIPVIPNGTEMIQDYYFYLIDTGSHLLPLVNLVINQVNLQRRVE